jgi:SAM-dependent methyltransferase
MKDPADIYTLDWFRGHADGVEEYRRVADSIESVLPAFRSVVDVGCGPAFALARLQELGHEVKGIEGSVHALHFCPIKDKVSIVDITTAKAKYFGTFDLVVCTEVAEHLEAVHADNLVNLLAGLAKDVIYFTAAPPGQGGTDHVNEQPPEYWIDKFHALRCQVDQELTERMRARLRDVMKWQFWYATNSLVFRKVA